MSPQNKIFVLALLFSTASFAGCGNNSAAPASAAPSPSSTGRGAAISTATAAQSNPALQPTGTNPTDSTNPNSNSDFPAFQFGGPLTGQIPAAPAYPLQLRWKYKGDAAFEGGAAIVNNVVYAADNQGTLYALNADSGKPLWTFDSTEGFSATPLVHNNIVYIGNTGGTFFAISTATGKEIWKFTTEAGIHSSATLATIPASPANPQPRQAILLTSDSGEIHCLTLDGKPIWSATADNRINSAPALSSTTAYIAGCDFKLRAYDLLTGKQLASTDLGQVAPGSAVLDNDLIFVGINAGHVLAFDSKTLEKKWDFDQIDDAAMVMATPAVSGNTVIACAQDHSVHAIDRATGKQLWRTKFSDDPDTSPLIHDGLIYTACRDSHIYILDLKTGDKLFSLPTPKPIASPLAITASLLVATDIAGNILCYQSAK